jgi:hypothetical protein
MEDYKSEESLFIGYKSPKYVGGYRLGKKLEGSIQFNLCYKPNWFHRKCMKIFLGWHWCEENTSGLIESKI